MDNGVPNFGSSNPYAQEPPSGLPASAHEPTAASIANAVPDPEPTSVNGIKQEAEAAGARVLDFDPDASPEEKAAQAVRGQALPVEGATVGRTNVGAAIPTDFAIDAKQAPQPTVSVQDAVQATSKEAEAPADPKEDNVPSAQLKDGKAPEIPDWYKVGWQSLVTKVANKTGREPEEFKNTLEDLIGAQHLGTVWHNAAAIFIAIFAVHYSTRLGGGLPLAIIICAVFSTYYSASIKRVRHRARDDISRELAKQRLYTEHETADWINNFLRRFWLAYEPLLSATIVMSVDQVLAESCPSFLESLRLTTFTLGTKAPRLEYVRTYADTDDETVVMDMKVSFTPNDTADLTPNQAAGKVNPKIVLAIKIGKGVASIGKDVVVEDITFSGLMRFRLKMMSNFPNIKTVEFSFLEKPLIDFVLKPIGFDLSLIPGLSGFIDGQIDANLGPMMYDPNSFVLDLEQMLSGAPIDTAIGVLQVTVFNARGLKATKIGGGTPDPYVSFSISQRAELARTKVKHSSNNPHWNDTKHLLVNSLNDVLSLTLFDWNEHRKDSELGIVNFSLKQLEQEPEHDRVSAPIMLQGKEKGTLLFAVNFFPVIAPKKVQGATGSEEAIPDSRSGIVRLTVHQAKDLDLRRTVSHSQANPYARIFLQNAPVGSTRTLKRTITPAWEHSQEFLVTDKTSAVVGVKIIDERGLSTDPVLGYVNVRLADLLEAKEKQKDWFPLSGCQTGRVRLTAEFKPVLMTGAFNGAQAYTAPIGIVRIWIKRAVDLKNVEGLTGGKSDPYLRVLERGIIMARTEVVNNNLNPQWDEILYVPVHSVKDKLVLEAMDYEQQGKDRSLGITELLVSSLVQENAGDIIKPFVATGKVEENAPLQSDSGKTVKGSVHYEASFSPCYPMPDISFEPPPTPAQIAFDGEETDGDEADTIASVHEPDEVLPDMVADAQRVQAESAAAPAPSADATQPNGVAATPAALAEKEEDKNKAPKLTREQLLKAQSGVLAINVVGGKLTKRGRLEILTDSAYWPAYTTEKARALNATFDEVGEVFIRELDYSRILFKLNEADKESNDDVFAEAAYDLNEFLELALGKKTDIVLRPLKNGGQPSTITVTAQYIPVEIQLEARESVNNTGYTRIDIIDAKGLRAMDRNGYSDPYAVIEVNGEKIFKSQTKKKTLKPVWNESTEFAVPSRTGAQCFVRVFDWDAVGNADEIGEAKVDLAALEPFQASTVQLELHDAQTGESTGLVNLKILFRPEFLNRTRAATSIGAGRIGTGVVGVGTGIVGGVGKGVGTVGKGAGKFAGKGFSGVAGRFGHNRKSSAATTNTFEADGPVPPLPDGTPVPQINASLDGSLKVTVLGAHAAGEKVSVHLKHDGKTVDKSHDVFTVKTGSGPDVLDFTLLEKSFLGKDKVLGNTSLSVSEIIDPSNGPAEASHAVTFGTDGQLELHLAWTPSFSPSGTASPASVKSKARFSRFGSSRRLSNPAEK